MNIGYRSDFLTLMTSQVKPQRSLISLILDKDCLIYHKLYDPDKDFEVTLLIDEIFDYAEKGYLRQIRKGLT